jgi:hypothetical protein
VQITIGRLVVSGWDRNEVSVEILRRAEDAQRLTLIPALVEERASGVLVRAVQADGGHDAGLRTDVVLRVPALAHLREMTVFEGGVELSDLRGACSARLERGDIVGTRLSGSVRLETAMGNIRLAAATLSTDGMIRLRTFNGDVTLELANRPEHARILALSMGGTITSDIPLAVKDRSGPRFGEATLGNASLGNTAPGNPALGDTAPGNAVPVISIDVVNGDVAITVAGAKR